MADGSNLIIGSESTPAWKQNNTGDATTKLLRQGTTTNDALIVENANGLGIAGIGTGASAGVAGISPSGVGVKGTSTSGTGVQGSASTGIGVEGNGASVIGVRGTSNTGSGVYGQSTSGLGVEAESLNAEGVFATSTKWAGVYAESINYVGVEGFAPLKPGVRGGSQDGAGILGDSDRNAGVYGICRGGPGPGVYGTAPTAGVRGESSNIGVQGTSKDYAGVVGNGPVYGTVGTSTNGQGVRGLSTGGNAVYGASINAAGVRGDSLNGIGVDAVSTFNHGVQGVTQASRATITGNQAGVNGVSMIDKFGVRGISLGARVFRVGGVIGIVGGGVLADAISGTALLARITGGPKGTGLAGAFSGEVVVDGNFTVFTGAKSAAVRHPDGSHRRLYTLESPESFFEDFGRARLSQGRAKVRLDPDFAALVRRDDYYVFLTPEGPTPGLYVSRKSRNGFEVRVHGEGAGPTTFCYRVVARRKDIEGRRLEKVAKPRFEGPEISRREFDRIKITKPEKVPARLRAPDTLEPPEVASLPRHRRTNPELRARQPRRKSVRGKARRQ